MNKKQLWATALTTPIFALSVLASLTQPSTASSLNIACNTNASTPTVIATVTEDRTAKNITILNFLSQYFSPEDAVQNCQKTAKVLQHLYNTNYANYLTNDKLNSQPVVCAVERRGIDCNHDSAQILFTLNPTANSSQALYEMLGSDFKQAQPPDARTVSRIYSEIKPRKSWWFF
ncbi:MAG: hypothetical protein HC862_11785 [Scytonema sp. RU_4_4]|nr:hypothetical protein [Scytonema sp. RU_4_4]NJR73924.1 hypothetical protein [Scytonema sp. CRU_2_7]